MNRKNPSTSIRPEVGIASKQIWDHTAFGVPRFYAVDFIKIARRLLIYGAIAAALYVLGAIFTR